MVVSFFNYIGDVIYRLVPSTLRDAYNTGNTLCVLLLCPLSYLQRRSSAGPTLKATYSPHRHGVALYCLQRQLPPLPVASRC